CPSGFTPDGLDFVSNSTRRARPHSAELTCTYRRRSSSGRGALLHTKRILRPLAFAKPFSAAEVRFHRHASHGRLHRLCLTLVDSVTPDASGRAFGMNTTGRALARPPDGDHLAVSPPQESSRSPPLRWNSQQVMSG